MMFVELAACGPLLDPKPPVEKESLFFVFKVNDPITMNE